MVTFLWNRLNQGMLPRFRVGGGFENETKKTTKHWRQLNRKFLKEPGGGGIPSGPEALFVFRKESTLRTLRVEMIGEAMGFERGKGGG